MYISNFETLCQESIEILCEGLISIFYFSTCSTWRRNV